MTHIITCPICGTDFVEATGGVTRQKTYKSTHFVGNGAASLRSVSGSKPTLPTQAWGSKTGQRIAQMGVSCCVVAIFATVPNVITGTGALVWFVSLLGGSDNWGVVRDFLDRNRDGKVNLDDLKHTVNAVLDEVLEDSEPSLPTIPVHVVKGTVTRMGTITGTTQEQLEQAGKAMFSPAHRDKPFSRDRVGSIFGGNFSKVQREMIELELLEGNRHAGYKLTNEGKAFLGRYYPSPTPDKVG